jgi:hypothetical protein
MDSPSRPTATAKLRANRRLRDFPDLINGEGRDLCKRCGLQFNDDEWSNDVLNSTPSRQLDNPEESVLLRFPTERTKPAPVLHPRPHYYSHAELTLNKQHCYCSWCDVFWLVGYNCFHFDEDKRRPVRS